MDLGNWGQHQPTEPDDAGTANCENADVTSEFDPKALKMMKLMGYKVGSGLGKNEQGIAVPIEVAQQLGTRGLGLTLENLEASDETWDFSAEDINVKEHVQWLDNNDTISFKYEEMKNWPRKGSPITIMDHQHNFCDKQVLDDVLKAKTIFDDLDLRELWQARCRANPFESIRSVFFMNRAAIKMANIDATTNFLFTKIDQNPLLYNSKGPYYFADLCAGPGGFSEYILWRKKWFFKGFGLTLRGDNDFKLSESQCASPATFQALYGARGDGDIYYPDNIKDFKEKVLCGTRSEGVHIVMADGGFSVEGNENIQEILSKNIYICQCLLALEVLRAHGHFVTKMFDVFTSFSVGLLFLMYNCFDRVCILKPNSSRPANSERYFIGCGLRPTEGTGQIRNYLRYIVEQLWNLQNSPMDILEIVPLDLLKNHNAFFNYISSTNNRLAKAQTVHLNKLAAFCRNPKLRDYRQDELRKLCLEFWQIPDQTKMPIPKNYNDLNIDLYSNFYCNECLNLRNLNDIENIIINLNSWYYTPLQTDSARKCSIYAGIGVSKCVRLQGDKWVRVKNLQLVRGTILYGELVKEKCKIVHNFAEIHTNKYSLHVIDALRLGDTNLNNLDSEHRQSLIRTYCEALNREFTPNTLRIRPKTLHKLHLLTTDSFFIESSNKFYSSLPLLGLKSVLESYEISALLLLEFVDGHVASQFAVDLVHNERPSSISQDLLAFIRRKAAN